MAGEELLENPGLHRIGILELIDQRRGETLARGCHERIAAAAVQRVAQPREQIVEGQNVALDFALLERGRRPREELALERRLPACARRGELAARGEERVPRR